MFGIESKKDLRARLTKAERKHKKLLKEFEYHAKQWEASNDRTQTGWAEHRKAYNHLVEMHPELKGYFYDSPTTGGYRLDTKAIAEAHETHRLTQIIKAATK